MCYGRAIMDFSKSCLQEMFFAQHLRYSLQIYISNMFGPDHDLWLAADEVPQHVKATYRRRRKKSLEQSERGQRGTARRERLAQRGRK